VEFLPEHDPEAADFRLRYVKNDACCSTIFSTGQMIRALKSGRSDLKRTAVLGVNGDGPCNMGHVLGHLRRAMQDSGLSHITLVELDNRASGSHWGTGMIHRLLMAVADGDVLLQCLHRTRPYEKIPGSVDALCENT
jgi:predicted nucleotide-binding protein (sugar kinase/HSP70/actin superfamily)